MARSATVIGLGGNKTWLLSRLGSPDRTSGSTLSWWMSDGWVLERTFLEVTLDERGRAVKSEVTTRWF